jgi:Fe-S-cluster-containing dehydrogenase component/anaerobic selenocysteine-containing dehydrogenase
MRRLGRRTFLGSAATVLGTSLVEGCKSKLPRSLVPYVTPPDDAVAGLARWYRTTCRACPAACGMTARVREGRAVQLEGNPEHPLSRGGLCPVGQASIESLYGPGRLASPWAGGKPIGWPEAEKALADGLRSALDAGKSVAVLTRPESGLLDAFLVSWLAALGQPAAHRVVFAGTARPWLAAGQRRALGSDALPVPVLTAARLILSIGDDFVEEWTPVESARDLAEQRAAGGRSLYVGPRLSLTAASSDDWIPVEPGSELTLVLGLCREVLRTAPPPELAPALRTELAQRLAPFDPATVGARTGLSPDRVSVLARVLTASRPGLVLGPGRVLAGTQADRLAEAVMVLNGLLGAFGNTLRFVSPPERPAGWDLDELTRRARAGEVGALIIHEVDPLGSGAGHRELADSLGRIPFVAALAVELDDTARRATLVLPNHHFLESWGDASPRPGVVGVQQPVMTPVLDTRAAADTLLGAARALGKTSGLPDGTWADVVRGVYDAKDREHGVKLSEGSTGSVALARSALSDLPVTPPPRRGPTGGLVLAASPNIRQLDGRVFRSALLQEIPDPLSGYAWTGWIELHPSTAAALGVREGDVVALGGARGEVAFPAHVTPAVHPGIAAVPAPEASTLLDTEAPPGLELRVSARRTGERQPTHLAEGGSEQHGRELARSVSTKLPVLPPARPLPQMYAPVEHPEHRWGMAVDLDRCTGCGACTAACYVENNLPVVGAEDVRRGRSMSWIRIHAYVEPGPEGVEASFLPLSCQHCTNAPCEAVCPTFATYHTREGINAQIYPRCIGTRYCENNCPYGVRRFNFFDWPRHGLSRLGLNPDVSVRERGVTEKCTLCIQRVTAGQEQAKMENRNVRDGEIVSACAASCPTRAITFGDLRDPSSQVSRLARDGRAYRLLEELNTQPGVVYLARRREKA